MVDSEKERLEALQVEKERRIGEYMSLQDRADDLNEQIYRLCCGIEALNGQIEREKDRAAKAEAMARLNGNPPVNGRHQPPKA